MPPLLRCSQWTTVFNSHRAVKNKSTSLYLPSSCPGVLLYTSLKQLLSHAFVRVPILKASHHFDLRLILTAAELADACSLLYQHSSSRCPISVKGCLC